MRRAIDGTEMVSYAESANMHAMLNLTVFLSFIIGLILVWMGRHGKILYLQVWGAGLSILSVAYLIWTYFYRV